MNYKNIINFWFEEIEPKQWWQKSAEFDQLIKRRFSDIHQSAVQCELYAWRTHPLGRLAEIIILDQFSRNMFRGTATAFAADPLALALAQQAVSLNIDQTLEPAMRNFLYMPYMHSESLLIHDEAVRLYESIGEGSNIKHEIKHRDIIVAFGRYPHRNEILDRASTAAEVAFLKQPGSTF